MGSAAGLLMLPAGLAAEREMSEPVSREFVCTARSGAEIARLTDDGELVDTLAAVRRMRARADAIEAHALARLGTLRREPTGEADPDTAQPIWRDSRYLPDEVALELRVTRRQAEIRLARATALVGRFPRLVAAMEDGELEGYAAGRVCEAAAGLTDEQARQVDDQLAAKRANGTLDVVDPVALRRTARRLALKIDPDGAVARARTARTGRKVELIPGEDSMATLVADLPAEVATSAYARIDRMAHAARRGGDERTLDQLRADIAASLLLGQDPGVAQPEAGAVVYLHMPITTALTMTDSGAELAGYGEIPGPIAREIMTNPRSVWRAILTDPGTGAITDLGRSRRHPTQLIRDLVNARDRECTVPGCHRPAPACDFDHLDAWAAEHGPTSDTNAAPKCRHDHAKKDHPDWHIEFDPNTGTATITTPTGRTYTKTRRAITEPPNNANNNRERERAGKDHTRQRLTHPPSDDPPF
ncbi:HNH endonuclease signature motif containing protein [Haloechinothrix salitolerans]